MFVFLVVFVFVILVDRRPSLFGFETGGFDFWWLLLSKAAVFAFLMGDGFGTFGTDLDFLCSYPYYCVYNIKCTAPGRIWIWAVREASNTMLCTPSHFCT